MTEFRNAASTTTCNAVISGFKSIVETILLEIGYAGALFSIFQKI